MDAFVKTLVDFIEKFRAMIENLVESFRNWNDNN